MLDQLELRRHDSSVHHPLWIGHFAQHDVCVGDGVGSGQASDGSGRVTAVDGVECGEPLSSGVANER